jgi:sulfite reductase (ferredoxin)
VDVAAEKKLKWKDALADRLDAGLADEIDAFETQLELRQQDKVDEKVFAETRLRRGVYGQRYDNGQRHDGVAVRAIEFPSSSLTKGPDTAWDAPGMQRIKIPFGGVTPEQLEVLADLAEEYSDGILHVTTRQDFQLHFIHIEDTPDLMRRLGAVGITSREACGNTVRNVTACPIAGVCRDEIFDVTPYSLAMADFLLGHPDAQDFGRKFKVAFSGCAGKACALVNMHDLGFIARERSDENGTRRGFEAWVGGGLGTIPYDAKLFEEFVPVEEILPLAQAIVRVFARLGEKRNRARARIKFLIARLGLEEFKRLVEEERAVLREDEGWSNWVDGATAEFESEPAGPRGEVGAVADVGAEYGRWARDNVQVQRQQGYSVATVMLPLGDMTSRQARQLADLGSEYANGRLRTTVEQNVVLRWVRDGDLPALYLGLVAAGLAMAGAGTISDITVCPGTDTCKLGIASSRGLTAELSRRLREADDKLDESIRGLHIKVSGCFNSCGQHHIADIGFYGVSRKVAGTTVPHFQVVLGGQWESNGGSYGLAVGAVPSRAIPSVVERLSDAYVAERGDARTFNEFIESIGKKKARALLEDLMPVPTYEDGPEFYSDWGDPREFTMSDLGVGECAGEVVAQTDFDLAEAERQVFDAQVLLDDKDFDGADRTALRSMLEAAKGLVRLENPDPVQDPDSIVSEFRSRFYDTELFFDRFAGGKFAQYLFHRYEQGSGDSSGEQARRVVEEARLFIEAAHACHGRMLEKKAAEGQAS